jgi:hypothetical protein
LVELLKLVDQRTYLSRLAVEDIPNQQHGNLLFFFMLFGFMPFGVQFKNQGCNGVMNQGHASRREPVRRCDVPLAHVTPSAAISATIAPLGNWSDMVRDYDVVCT